MVNIVKGGGRATPHPYQATSDFFIQKLDIATLCVLCGLYHPNREKKD
jgi:hypothetical protein